MLENKCPDFALSGRLFVLTNVRKLCPDLHSRVVENVGALAFTRSSSFIKRNRSQLGAIAICVSTC